MVFASLSRILLFTWQSFWRNFWLSLVTITVIGLTFISINFLIIMNVATDSALKIVRQKVDVSIYFKNDTGETKIQEVQTFLSSLTQVDSVRLITQNEALESFRQLHKDDPVIIQSLEELSTNPLGSTLVVKAKDTNEYAAIIAALEGSEFNDLILRKNFDDHKKYIEQINSFAANIRLVGIISTVVFSVIALLIVFNTIRVAVYTHRREIGIMKLVGATNWFISSPFLLESVLYGLLSALVAVPLIYLMLNFSQPYLNAFFQSGEVNLVGYFNKNFWKIFGLETLAIITLSMLSSAVAIRRYLKV